MREYLFRAKTEPCSKDAISGKIELKPKWIYGYIDLGYMRDGEGAIISDEKARHAYRCQYSTIGQYTGLTDKNGRRIFEGDIVECCSEGVTAQGAVQRRKDGLWIIYPAWQKTIMWGLCPDEYCHTTVEVIGNIHDNPELMKEDTHGTNGM